MPSIYLGPGDSTAQTFTAPGDYTIGIAAFTADPVLTFDGAGTFNLNIAASLLASYTLVAAGGANLVVTSDGELFTNTNLIIDGASSVTFTDEYSALSSVVATFSGGGGGTLSLPAGVIGLGDPLPVVSNFGPHDNINFGTGGSGDQVVYTPTGPDTGILTLENSSGGSLGSVTLIGSYSQSNFMVADVGGVDEIEFACFLAGTKVLTPSGEVAVESLQTGDQVMTLENGPALVRAVRLRSFAAGATSAKLLPVCITAGALAENVPHRDLWVSPDHAMYLHNVLIPAQLLVNDETILQPARGSAIFYYHVEIEPHDVIIAEGAATESYLDVGSRGHFAEAGGVALLPATDPKTWEDACAPLVLTGPQLAAVKAELAERTQMLAGQRAKLATAA